MTVRSDAERELDKLLNRPRYLPQPTQEQFRAAAVRLLSERRPTPSKEQ